jgi:hypothetical protein
MTPGSAFADFEYPKGKGQASLSPLKSDLAQMTDSLKCQWSFNFRGKKLRLKKRAPLHMLLDVAIHGNLDDFNEKSMRELANHLLPLRVE